MEKNTPYRKNVHGKVVEKLLEGSKGKIAWINPFPNRADRRAK